MHQLQQTISSVMKIVVSLNYGTLYVQPSRVRLSDIHYINIRGTSSTPNAVELFCSSQYPCQNVELHDIDLKSQQRGPTAASCTNAKVRFGGKMNPPPCK